MVDILHEFSHDEGPSFMAENLKTPLIREHSTTANDTSSFHSTRHYDPDEEDRNLPTKTHIVVATATTILLTAGVAASVVAMVTAQSMIVYVAGAICILHAPVVAHRQYRISKGVGEFQFSMKCSNFQRYCQDTWSS